MRKYAIKNAFESVDDLNDTDQVTTILNDFNESHKGIIASATAPSGSGDTGSSGAIKRGEISPDKMTTEERAEHIRSKQASSRI